MVAVSALYPSATKPLVGPVVRLVPFVEADADELAPLLVDQTLHESGYVMYEPPTTCDEAHEVIWSRLVPPPGSDPTERVAYAVRLAAASDLGEADTLVGSRRWAFLDPVNEGLHIGWTLYGRRWWGTAVNPAAKLILMTEAFEQLGYGRVQIVTDLLNVRSQAAITKLGATREGVLRRHMVRGDGTFRDTVVFSILAAEWPDVKAGLQRRLHAVALGEASPTVTS